MDISTAEITFACPNCEFENTVTLGQVARDETIICNGCMADIQLGSCTEIIPPPAPGGSSDSVVEQVKFG